jgi:general secretion pathway protein A
VAAAAASASASAPVFLSASDLSGGFKSMLHSEADAWRELAPLWNLPVADGDPCQAAQRSQVNCFRSKTNLALIRQLGRPGIVTLHDESDKPVYALLTGLTGQSATLRAGAVSQTVSLLSLATVWRGDFATFWRVPPDYRNVISDNHSGPVVDALAAQLATLNGQAQPSRKQTFDVALKAKLSAFQLAQGLKPDGAAGPTTFMQLNRATGIDEPRLQGDAPAATPR